MTNELAPALTVVVPVYNEVENMDILFDRLTKTLESYGREYEILFIDDGSTDGSVEKMRQFHEQDEHVRVIRFGRNFGQQMAVAAGFKYAIGERLVIIDADLQTLPEEIPTLVDKLDEGFDIVYGVRQRRRDPIWRRMGSWCMSNLLYRITGIEIPDAASGFIAVSRTMIDSLNLFNDKSRYFGGLFAWLSYGRSASVLVSHCPRRAGKSKYNLRKLIVLVVNFICSFSVMPLQFPTYIGSILFMITLLSAIVLPPLGMSGYLPGNLFSWILLWAVFFFMSIQMLMLGLMGEYIARIYIEVKDRPSYVVREIWERPQGKEKITKTT